MTHSEKNPDRVHVAVGVIVNTQGQILIAKRPAHLHQGGCWEFPGGKLGRFETVGAALARELSEELSIQVDASFPLISIPYQYPDKQVYLDVYKINQFTGVARGNEGQEVRWVELTDIHQYEFPEANKSIITALQLPDRYLITGKFANAHECEKKIHSAIERGIRLIQLRQKDLTDPEFLVIANKLCKMVESSSTKVILNTSLVVYEQTSADGIHLTGERLCQCEQRPVAWDKYFSASTHSLNDLQHAANIGVDFAVLSPVLTTPSHPGESAMGWANFSKIVNQIPIPVYALGGMTNELICQAQQKGAQGIAAISALWNEL